MRTHSLLRPASSSLLAFAAACLSLACSSEKNGGSGSPLDDAGTAGDSGGLPAASCGADWEAECQRQGCDPTDAAWKDCKINGWAGYVAAPHCAVSSGFAGDGEALCAPAPEDGLQLHFGPTHYDDPDELAKYTLAPGVAAFDCSFLQAPADQGKYWGQYIARSRPGAHHAQMTYAGAADTTPSGTSRTCNIIPDLLGTAGTFIAIAQSPELDVPDLSTPRPSDATDDAGLDFEGSAAPMESGRMLQLLTHFLNTSDAPVLKEAWFNFYYRDPSEVKSTLYTISLIPNGIAAPPKMKSTFRRSATTTVDRNIKYLQGHSHIGTDRFTIWHTPAGGGTLAKVYESYDPEEPENLAFSRFVNNPAPDEAAHKAGGASGAFLLEAGGALTWECEIDNQSDRIIRDGDPNPAAFGQMCYTYGSFAVPMGEDGGNWITGGDPPAN